MSAGILNTVYFTTTVLECVNTSSPVHVCDLDPKQTLILLATTLTSALMFGHKLTYVEIIHASTQFNRVRVATHRNNRYLELIRIQMDDQKKLEHERSSLLELLERDLPADDLRRSVSEALSNSGSATPNVLSTPLSIADGPRTMARDHEASVRLQLPAKIEAMRQRFEGLQLDHNDDELALRVANNMTSASFDAFGPSGSDGQRSSQMLNLHVDDGRAAAASASGSV